MCIVRGVVLAPVLVKRHFVGIMSFCTEALCRDLFYISSCITKRITYKHSLYPHSEYLRPVEGHCCTLMSLHFKMN